MDLFCCRYFELLLFLVLGVLVMFVSYDCLIHVGSKLCSLSSSPSDVNALLDNCIHLNYLSMCLFLHGHGGEDIAIVIFMLRLNRLQNNLSDQTHNSCWENISRLHLNPIKCAATGGFETVIIHITVMQHFLNLTLN